MIPVAMSALESWQEFTAPINEAVIFAGLVVVAVVAWIAGHALTKTVVRLIKWAWGTSQ